MVRSDSLVCLTVLMVVVAAVTVASGRGHLRRNPLLGLNAAWLRRSDDAWRSGHRAAAPLMCVLAAVVLALTATVLVLRSGGLDVDLLAAVTVAVAPIGVGAAAILAGVAAYRSDPVEYRWRSGPPDQRGP